MKSSSTVYILTTGAQDVERLRLLNLVYGPASHAVLRQAGLAEGLRVAEMGCGTGNVTCWIARQVGHAARSLVSTRISRKLSKPGDRPQS
jgi:tRNA A58 N-methylase Trm61